MDATAAGPVEQPAPRRLGLQRIAVYGCVAVSAVFLAVDAAGGGLDANRPDLMIELVARLLMLVLAVLAARATRGDRNLALLLWGVVFISFDTYWQTTYRNVGGKPLEWIEMVVKYVTIGLGLGLLLRFCAGFGDAADNGLRRRLRDWSLAIGGALTAVGLVHGVLYIQSCYFFVPGRHQCIVSDAALLALNAYLAVDAVLRLAIVAAAMAGYLRSSPDFKQRTLLVAFGSVVFALGTAVDFLARLRFGYDAIVVLGVVDAVTTLLFPLALLYASTRRQLFDVEYVVQRSISTTIAAGILFTLWDVALTSSATMAAGMACVLIALVVLTQRRAAAGYRSVSAWARRNVTTMIVLGVTLLVAAGEVFFHEKALAVSELVLKSLHAPENIAQTQAFHYAVGVPFVLMWMPLEELFRERVSHALFGGRHQRLERLRAFVDRIPFVHDLVELEHLLHQILRDGIWAKFADIFVHDGKAGYGVYVSNREARPPYFHAHEPPIPRLSPRKPLCLGCSDEDVPDAELMVSMPAGSKQFGILLCGKPKGSEVAHYAPDEVAAISLFAAIAGNALYAHGAKLARVPRKESP